MSGDRPAYGSVVAALGAVVLAVSVYLPWYGVSITSAGVQAAQQASDQVAAQLGDAELQSVLAGARARFDALTGRQLASVSARDWLSNVSVALLVLAGIALLLALRSLAGADSLFPDVRGGWISLPGVLAACLVLYRTVRPPEAENGYLALSLRGGIWLALLGCAAIIAGGLWSRPVRRGSAMDADLSGACSELSGWTPGS